MKSRLRLALALVMLVAACAPACCGAVQEAPIVAYIRQPDVSYTWTKESETKLADGGSEILVKMTSQTWQQIPWKHDLSIIRPEKVRTGSTVLLLITGGHRKPAVVEMVARFAAQTGTPAAVLFDIPNQPLFDNLNEDGLISYTFVKYLKTNDVSWPLLFPMVKSAIRAMDTIQKVAVSEWKSPVRGFVVTGASKRGWTTWLTGAMDRRVVGIAPIVYDNLNLAAQMRQQTAMYGSYSEQIADYSTKGLPQLLESPEGRELARAVDPYTFLGQLTLPKLLLHGTNDPYWTLESANLYYPSLPGDKHVVYVPNGTHSIMPSKHLPRALIAFTVACSEKRKLPKLSWDYRTKPEGITLTIHATHKPTAVRVWTATSDTKDFREATWASSDVTADGTGWTFALPKPKLGYAAVFGEADFTDGGNTFSQSTTPKMVGAQ